MASELKFADEHVDAILDGEKTVTIRYGLEPDYDVGEVLELRNQNGRLVTEARVVTQLTIEAWVMADLNFAGHASYESTDELLGEMEAYYPDAHLTQNTPLDAIVFATGPFCAGGDA